MYELKEKALLKYVNFLRVFIGGHNLNLSAHRLLVCMCLSLKHEGRNETLDVCLTNVNVQYKWTKHSCESKESMFR